MFSTSSTLQIFSNIGPPDLGVCQTAMKTRSPITDRIVYDTLIRHQLDDNTLQYLYQHKQNGHLIKKAKYNK